MKPHEYTEDGVVLFLRRCNADYTSHGGFQWPSEVSAVVEAPDWKPTSKCGNGLHGWPWGMGLGEGMDFDIIHDSWIVFSAKPEDIIGELEGGTKAKVRVCSIVASGSFGKCWDVIDKGRDMIINEMSKTSSGNYSTAASSGNSSTAASSGVSSKAASSGYYSMAASSGDSSMAASSGDYSKAASSGYYSKAASSGDYSMAEAIGANTMACVCGVGGMVKVGDGGAFAIGYKRSDGSLDFLIGRAGDNVKPDTWYKVVDGELVEVAK